jgi:diguanylate cyclase (GGDEF)-like protein
MWLLTLRGPSSSPDEIKIKPGNNTIGRKPDNDIVIADESASRNHAEIYCHDDLLVICDMKSTNGTFVNRERINGPRALKPEDQIRIGQYTAIVTYQDEKNATNLVAAFSSTRPLTRELLLESVDQHAVLLYEVVSRLTNILDLRTAIQETSELMRVAMGAEKCEVILADGFDQLENLGFPTSIAMKAIEQRSVVIIPDLSSHSEDHLSQSALLRKIHSVLCVPVVLEGDVVALIYVYKTNPNMRPFDQHDLQLAVAISYQTAMTIQRANLLERSRMLEQKVNVDSLTGLYTRPHFIDLAAHEFQRSLRFEHPMTVIMLDIDQFKGVNDTFGHLAGDQVLKEVAMRCMNQVRDIDLIGRFGGDEFVFLLMETDTDNAKMVAERVRHWVADTPVMTEKGPLAMTVSMGLATLKHGCPDLTGLLTLADNALLTAKKAGRNQVEIAIS